LFASSSKAAAEAPGEPFFAGGRDFDDLGLDCAATAAEKNRRVLTTTTQSRRSPVLEPVSMLHFSEPGTIPGAEFRDEQA
jgi:hypothetical protein